MPQAWRLSWSQRVASRRAGSMLVSGLAFAAVCGLEGLPVSAASLAVRLRQALRRVLDAQAPVTPAPATRQLELPLEPYQMIIQLDAWNLRERDEWGRSAVLRRNGEEPEQLALGVHGHLFPAGSPGEERRWAAGDH